MFFCLIYKITNFIFYSLYVLNILFWSFGFSPFFIFLLGHTFHMSIKP